MIKEGWVITNDPLLIQFGGIDQYIDLGAERVIAAEKGKQKIAVEIKSFLGTSLISEFHTALGQYLNYRIALSKREPERVLYLAIPTDTYQTFFMLPFAQLAIEEYALKLLVYRVDDEVIVKWQS